MQFLGGIVAATNKQDDNLGHLMIWSKYCAQVSEDVGRAVIGFIPHGLNNLYDFLLKPTPILGTFFSHRWVEEVLKLCLGITIGQGIALDLGRYLFKPIGFLIGALLGSFFDTTPKYQGIIGKILYRLSAQVVGGSRCWATGTFSCLLDDRSYYLLNR